MEPLFDNEVIRLFFVEIKNIINDCFTSLHDVVLSTYSDRAEQISRFQRGLSFVATDMNKNENYSEIKRATSSFPHIRDNYRRAIRKFAQYIVPPEHLRRDLECPSFDSFLFELYKRTAVTTEMRSGKYFSMTYSEQENFLKDLLRVTMSSCIRYGSSDASVIMPDDSVSNVVTPRRRSSSILVDAISVANSNNLSVFRQKQKLEHASRAPSRPEEKKSVLKTKEIELKTESFFNNEDDGDAHSNVPASEIVLD